jgi:hypothetical protein
MHSNPNLTIVVAASGKGKVWNLPRAFLRAVPPVLATAAGSKLECGSGLQCGAATQKLHNSAFSRNRSRVFNYFAINGLWYILS